MKVDTTPLQNISDTYIKKWETFAMTRDGSHAKLAYNWYGSWTTLYSLYADAVLCFHPSITNNSSAVAVADSYPDLPHNRAQAPLAPSHTQAPLKPSDRPRITHDFIPHHVYSKQSSWYANVMQRYGLPLDSRHLYTKSDWEFEAAAVASKDTRTEILDCVSRWINETETDRPFTDLYETEGRGGFPGPRFFARPVVGGHFAFLTLERACRGRH